MIESHLTEKHEIAYRMNSFFSPVQMVVAGMLGIALQVEKRNNWKCPFGYCKREFTKYSEISDHINKYHAPHEKFLFENVGRILGGYYLSFE